jgi:hypothetical protein
MNATIPRVMDEYDFDLHVDRPINHGHCTAAQTSCYLIDKFQTQTARAIDIINAHMQNCVQERFG